jgi:hypothetical protein
MLPFALEGEHHLLRKISVYADETGPPVLLVLSAYDPVVWDLSAVPQRRLRGVLVYGYSAQAVAKLASGIPARFVTGSRATGPCGSSVYAYEGGRELERLNSEVKMALGVNLTAFHGDYDPAALHIDGGAMSHRARPSIRISDLQSSAAITDESR